MNLLKVGFVVALVVLCASVVAAPAAFATVANTTSNGNAPYITPIGNTTNSSVTGTGANSTFATTDDNNVTCSVSGSGYVPPTVHTGAHITSIAFTDCTSTVGDAVVTDTVTSPTPWILHVTSFNAGTGSATGTVAVAGTTNINITAAFGLVTCDLTVAPQSVDGTFTNANTSLVVNDSTVAFTRTGSGLCPPSGNATQTGTVTFTPDTNTDDLRVTSTSDP